MLIEAGADPKIRDARLSSTPRRAEHFCEERMVDYLRPLTAAAAERGLGVKCPAE
jgi:hypothetical protein